jgi:cellulose synthase operon protein YhjQ
MTDRKTPTDHNETPEDVATLYAWANLHGAKYRDFSVSRAETRESARLRVQDAIEQELRRGSDESEQQSLADAQHATETIHATESAQQSELVAQHANEHQAETAALQALQQAAQQATRQPELAAQQDMQQREWQRRRSDRSTALPAPDPEPAPQAAPSYAPRPQQFNYRGYATALADRPVVSQPKYAPMGEGNHEQPRDQWAPADLRENAGRPAWLASERADAPTRPVPQAPENTLQGSRDRLASRWFALKGVFDGVSAPVEPVPAPVTSLAPVLAVFSLVGGVGKTTLVATLGRSLSARGEKVLLVDTAAYGLLQFFFGARDKRPGMLRTFNPPGTSCDAPIQMVAIDPDALGPETAGHENLTGEIAKHSRGVSRVIVDLATASDATARCVMRMAPVVLVPIVPDMSSVVSISLIDSFFQHNSNGAGRLSLPYFVLNQFDSSLPLHLDVREVLREQLGDRLLPFALHRTPAVSEALAEGMTVMDYAPNSPVAQDFGSLAGWVKSVSAPAITGYRGVRWSER